MSAPTVDLTIPDVSPLHVSPKGTVLLDRHATPGDPRDPGDPEYAQHAVIVETAHSWWLTVNGAIVHAHSGLRAGQSRPRGGGQPKRWQRWQLGSMHTLSRTRYGYWLLTERTKNGGRHTHKITEARQYELLFPEHIRMAAGWGTAGPSTVEDIYPFISHYTNPEAGGRRPGGRGRTWPEMIDCAGPEFSRRLVGATTARDIAVNLFGTTRVTKALVKAIGNPNLPYSRLELAWTLRGLVPTDWLIDYLRGTDTPPPGMSRLRPALRILTRTVLRRLLKPTAYGTWSNRMKDQAMLDLIIMVNQGNHLRTPARTLERVRTWVDLHDAIATGVVTSKERWSAPTDLKPAEGPVGEWSIRLLRTHDSLVTVGSQLDNCIGSYQAHAKAGRSVLAAVDGPDGKPIAAIELERQHRDKDEPKRWQLTQLLGRFNRPLPKPLHDQLVTHLLAATAGHVEIPDSYWGRV